MMKHGATSTERSRHRTCSLVPGGFAQASFLQNSSASVAYPCAQGAPCRAQPPLPPHRAQRPRRARPHSKPRKAVTVLFSAVAPQQPLSLQRCKLCMALNGQRPMLGTRGRVGRPSGNVQGIPSGSSRGSGRQMRSNGLPKDDPPRGVVDEPCSARPLHHPVCRRTGRRPWDSAGPALRPPGRQSPHHSVLIFHISAKSGMFATIRRGDAGSASDLDQGWCSRHRVMQ